MVFPFTIYVPSEKNRSLLLMHCHINNIPNHSCASIEKKKLHRIGAFDIVVSVCIEKSTFDNLVVANR